MACATGQRVRRSATAFMLVMRPCAAVAITPSPMECSVMARFSSLWRSSASAFWRVSAMRSNRRPSSVSSCRPVAGTRDT